MSLDPERTFTYEIGGRKYHQRPLVLGQLRQMLTLLKDVSMPEELSPTSIVDFLGDKLPLAFAIVLTPEDVKLQDKVIEELASEFEFTLPLTVVMQVVQDFFECNPISLLLNMFNQTMQGLTKQLQVEPTMMLDQEIGS